MSELFTYGEVGGVGGNSGPYPDIYLTWSGSNIIYPIKIEQRKM